MDNQVPRPRSPTHTHTHTQTSVQCKRGGRRGRVWEGAWGGGFAEAGGAVRGEREGGWAVRADCWLLLLLCASRPAAGASSGLWESEVRGRRADGLRDGDDEPEGVPPHDPRLRHHGSPLPRTFPHTHSPLPPPSSLLSPLRSPLPACVQR
eukprot:738901-Rhodomonas_salina.1